MANFDRRFYGGLLALCKILSFGFFVAYLLIIRLRRIEEKAGFVVWSSLQGLHQLNLLTVRGEIVDNVCVRLLWASRSGAIGGRLNHDLSRPKVMIFALSVDEITVRAFFDDFAIHNNQDVISFHNRGEAVAAFTISTFRKSSKRRDDIRNNKGGTAVAQSLEAFLYQLLGLSVDSAGSFVKKNDFRLL